MRVGKVNLGMERGNREPTIELLGPNNVVFVVEVRLYIVIAMVVLCLDIT